MHPEAGSKFIRRTTAFPHRRVRPPRALASAASGLIAVSTILAVLVVGSAAASAQMPGDQEAPEADTDLPYELTRGLDHAVLAYEYAGATAPCLLDWTLLGGIADVASDHARLGGAQRLRHDGLVQPFVIGLPLDGTEGRALVADTDQGRIDGDPDIDRATGPFQFIPTTWERYAVDGNGDGAADPHNLWDAAASAAGLLCDHGVQGDPAAAVTAYFGTQEWTSAVLRSAADLRALEWSKRFGTTAGGAWPQDVVIIGALELAGPTEPTEPTGRATLDEAGSVTPAVEEAELIVGDWNGDGLTGSAELVTGDDTGLRSILLLDHEGRRYGRSIDVSRSLITAGLRSTGATVLVGDWDGDGTDGPGVLATQDGVATLVTFGRDGQVDELRPVGLAEPGTRYAVVDRPTAAFVADPAVPSGVFWETLIAPDGSTLSLYRIGNIVVEQSISASVEALLAHAGRDGLVLDGWGWRSHEQQIGLRARNCADVWSTPASSCSPPTALPGTSRHEFGRAIDFHVGGRTIDSSSLEFRWLTDHAAGYGLYNLASEPWHWSTDGG